jgi:23S rRNA (cytidine1920-2'-O)/16S rRNA (cytidine1409-2'-O)-methyltransferase
MKERIDILLVERRLVDSRTKAQWLIKNGYVLVNKKQFLKPSKRIENTLEIKLIKGFPYVGRGGLKLETALKEFSIPVKGKICADIGASVGGFTDCLIKHRALRVYAIDTATDLLHPSLQCEKMKEKIIPLLGVDARNLIPIEEFVDICTIDVTFTSLRSILPKVKRILKKNGDIIALVKPVFETEFHKKNRFDVIQDPNQLFHILKELIQWSIDNNFFLYSIINSPVLNKGDSKEFFIHIRMKKPSLSLDFENLIKYILDKK